MHVSRLSVRTTLGKSRHRIPTVAERIASEASAGAFSVSTNGSRVRNGEMAWCPEDFHDIQTALERSGVSEGDDSGELDLTGAAQRVGDCTHALACEGTRIGARP